MARSNSSDFLDEMYSFSRPQRFILFAFKLWIMDSLSLLFLVNLLVVVGPVGSFDLL